MINVLIAIIIVLVLFLVWWIRHHRSEVGAAFKRGHMEGHNDAMLTVEVRTWNVLSLSPMILAPTHRQAQVYSEMLLPPGMGRNERALRILTPDAVHRFRGLPPFITVFACGTLNPDHPGTMEAIAQLHGQHAIIIRIPEIAPVHRPHNDETELRLAAAIRRGPPEKRREASPRRR